VFYESISVSGGFAPAQSDVTFRALLFIAWITISLAMACWIIMKTIKFRDQLRYTRPVGSEELPGGLSGLRVVEMDVHSPFLFGLTQPTVVLHTSKAWDAPFLSAAIASEGSHCEAWDLAVLFVEQMAVCLLWFHPAIWTVRNRLHLLREFRSDERVLAAGTIPKVHYVERLADLI
jgi:beta-lactamase regulating signal transducer with metallopeptidase domain